MLFLYSGVVFETPKLYPQTFSYSYTVQVWLTSLVRALAFTISELYIYEVDFLAPLVKQIFEETTHNL